MRTGKRAGLIGKVILVSMEDTKKYTYNDFWEMRARQSIWVTRNVSYRMGSAIALIASRIGISPDMISMLSGLITVSSAMFAILLGHGTVLSGLVLVVGLQLGYAFDCADGPLARATGQGSSFGVLLDKLVDLASGMIFPCILAYGIGHCYFYGKPYTVRVLIMVLILRVICSVMMWIKELVIHNADRLKEDPRSHTVWWKLKKLASVYIDEPVYRLIIGLTWSIAYFWEVFVAYHIGLLILSLGYLASSKKEMDQMDREESLTL